jgi:integrase/recombinase XerC
MARREFQDPSVLERDSKGGREYYIRYREKQLVNGKTKRIEKWHHLGYCAKMTRRQAEREKAQILRGINDQVYTLKSQVPFADVAREFREKHVEELEGPSQATYKQHLSAYIEPAFKDLRLCDVDTQRIEQLFSTMENSGLARSTRHTCKGIIKAIFGFAKREGYMETNPVRDADVGGGPRRVRECRVPSLDDIVRLMDSCEGDVPLLIETLYTTGMRISEASGLLVSHLDFQRGVVRVRRKRCRGSVGKTKSDSGARDLPMGDLAGALAEHVRDKRPDDPIFTWKGEPIVDNTLLANYLSPRMVDLGIKFPGFGWHTFRRLHLSLMSKRGLSLFELRQQAGHADVRTTYRYIADDLSSRAEAAKALPKLQLVKKKGAA